MMRKNLTIIYGAVVLINLFVFLLFPQQIIAQAYPSNYFRPPTDLPLRITGTFAEFRYDHLHTGIDIPVPMRTPMRAVADGYVSRIRLQAGGFGRALYINHPNGYTSVYAHLDNFSPELEKFLKEEQYSQNTFEVDYYPDSLKFKVRKGEIVAFSGNSGLSQGPHLHFELRQTATESPTNPLLFKLPVSDWRPPIIKLVKVYPVYPYGEIITGIAPTNIPMVKSGTSFRPKAPGIIKVPPFVVFGISAADVSGTGNRNGLYGMDVMLDDITVYQTGMDCFSFSNFRAVNSIVDYPLYQKTGQFIQMTRIAPCNGLNIFMCSKNQGVFDLSDGKPHKVTIKLSDIQNNITEIVFQVESLNAKDFVFPARVKDHPEGIFPCDRPNDFVKEDIRFHMPEGALFDTLRMEYNKTTGRPDFYSEVHTIQNSYTPLNELCVLSLKPSNLPAEYREKACIAKVAGKGISYVGGRYENGWVTGLTRKFGSFTIVIDRTPPIIQKVGTKRGKKKASSGNQMKFKIGDNFSGVQSYCGYVNGNWVLMDYNFKTHTLTYIPDNQLKPGKNSFELYVTDKVGNESVYRQDIIR